MVVAFRVPGGSVQFRSLKKPKSVYPNVEPVEPVSEHRKTSIGGSDVFGFCNKNRETIAIQFWKARTSTKKKRFRRNSKGTYLENHREFAKTHFLLRQLPGNTWIFPSAVDGSNSPWAPQQLVSLPGNSR